MPSASADSNVNSHGNVLDAAAASGICDAPATAAAMLVVTSTAPAVWRDCSRGSTRHSARSPR
jgi:hypothetical protein